MTGTTWYWSNAVDFAINGSTGDFPLNYTLPGIPGTTGLDNNLAAGLVDNSLSAYYLKITSQDAARVVRGTAGVAQLELLEPDN